MATTGESSESTTRRRRVAAGQAADELPDSGDEQQQQQHGQDTTHSDVLQKGTYWLTRVVLLRATAFIYFVAFAVAYHQNNQLIGGARPDAHARPTSAASRVTWEGQDRPWPPWRTPPSILWFMDWSEMDSNLAGVALVGLALSSFVLLSGTANMVIMTALWVLYHSLGQRRTALVSDMYT
ncbi:hypothetical protein CRUP_004896 [Coryphaenoides rupestris]|nr:hypothetical protein CRUP_004896 [Coryphaenoides rupestris]